MAESTPTDIGMLPGGGGTSDCVRSSKPQPEAPHFRHMLNAREIFLRSSSSSSSAASSEALLPSPPPKSCKPNPTNVEASQCDGMPYSASAVMVINNEDLLSRILLGLPPRPLLRFQCVSKLWLSIVSDPAFRRLHYRHYPANSSFSGPTAIFLFHKIYRTAWVNFISFREEQVKSLGNITSALSNFLDRRNFCVHCCNGLLCIMFESRLHHEYLVYNPTTGEQRLIPRQITEKRLHVFRAINIAFDPLKSDYYKIVCVWSDDYHRVYIFYVYSSETGLWKEVEERLEMPNERVYFENGALWNGDIHWASESQHISSLDLDKDCLKENMPSIPATNESFKFSYTGEFCYFGKSCGGLYAIVVSNREAMQFEVFELLRDYSKWVSKYCIDLLSLTKLYHSMPEYQGFEWYDRRPTLYVPFLLMDEKEKNARLVITSCRKVFCYDINDMTVKELAKVDHRGSYKSNYRWYEAYQHIETLAPV